MRPAISVVVPVYKVEQYLTFCVQSIFAQTFSDWELILVDDGSPDRCGEMCDALAEKDERVRVIHKENGGLADARNAGTALARGDYITYIDSDDWVAPQLLERLLEHAQKEQADVVICNMVKADSEQQMFPNSGGQARAFSGPEAMEEMLYQTSFDTNAWGKLFRLELAKRFPYPKGRLYEDLFTIYKMLFSVRKVVYLPQALYAYRINQDSIMNRKFDARNLDELDAADEIEQFVVENCPEYLPAAKARKFSSYSQVFRWMGAASPTDTQMERVREKIWTYLKGYRVGMATDRRARMKNRVAALCTFGGKAFFSKI